MYEGPDVSKELQRIATEAGPDAQCTLLIATTVGIEAALYPFGYDKGHEITVSGNTIDEALATLRHQWTAQKDRINQIRQLIG